MKTSAAVWASLGALLATTCAAQSALEQAQAAYPDCALACLSELIPQSDCSMTDVNCLCTNVPLNANLTLCVGGGCNTLDALTTQNVSSTMCGEPVRDETATPLLIGLIGGAVALIAFVLRLIATFPMKGRKPPGWDDHTIIVTAALTVPPTIFAVLLSHNGLGKDIWTLPLKNIENVLLYYYMGELFYFAAQAMNKISLLFFILRIFPEKAFRKYIYGTMGIVVAYGISFILATALQCSPINYSWYQIDPSHQGTCNNIHLQSWFSAIFNIVIDIIILALPLPHLYGLNIGMKKKIMVMFMFSLGVFVTIISVIRLQSLIRFANSSNVTYDYMAPAYWSTMELHAGIVCASLPAIRMLFINFGVNFLASTKKGEQSASNFSMGTSQSKLGSRLDHQQAPKRGDEGDFVPLVDVEVGRGKGFDHAGPFPRKDIKVSTSIVTSSESDLSIQRAASQGHGHGHVHGHGYH